jgi:Ca-activated chloride channel family protein
MTSFLSRIPMRTLVAFCAALTLAACSSTDNPAVETAEESVSRPASPPAPATEPMVSNAPSQRADDAEALSRWVPQNQQARGYASDQVMPEPYSREGYAAREENGFQRPEQHPFSTFGVDVDRAGYANVRRFLNDGQLPVPGAVRLEEMVNYFDYDLPQPEADGRAPFSLVTESATCPWQPGHRLVRVALQGREVSADKVPPSALVFLLDTSGSMNSPDKLGLLAAGMKMLAQQLRPEDRVAIVTYAGSAGLVLEPTPGTPHGKEQIMAALDRLSAGGSTAGGQGIELAYRVAEAFVEQGDAQNVRVILATDGDFNVGASSNAEMMDLVEEKRETGVFLSVLGLGTGNLQDEKMELLADHGNGQYNYLDSIDEARRVLVSEMAGTLFAIAKDVKVRVQFNPAKVAAYRLLGYENRLLAAEDFEDDRKDAGEIGAGHAVTALYEVIPAGVDSPALDALPKLVGSKYQRTTATGAGQDELLTVELKWKRPDADDSEPAIERAIADRQVPMDDASADFRFASAVAELALLLSESDHRADARYDRLVARARAARGADEDGYRAEFVRLAETAAALAGTPVAQR